MSNTNMKIRSAKKEKNIFQWQLAELLGVSEATFTRMMRRELPEDEQEKIVSLIKAESETR